MNTSQQKIYNYFEREPELKVLFIFNDVFLADELSVVGFQRGLVYYQI